MDAELGRQIGNAVTALGNSLLEHQRSSARDRGIMLQKMDDNRDEVNAKLDKIGLDIKDVCDRGRSEHRSFDDRLTALERRFETDTARKQGADQMRQFFAGAVTWTLEHGWKAAMVLYIAGSTLIPMAERYFAPRASAPISALP